MYDLEIKRCLDTYAIMEIYQGNEVFLKFLSTKFIIPNLILLEFFGVMLRDYGEEEANIWYNKLKRYSVHVSDETIMEAIKFRHKNKKTGISFFDAVGYIFSLRNNYIFVTGDKEFKNFDKVEFVK